MKTLELLFMAGIVTSMTMMSCKKEVDGCTDSTATNYNSSATNDNNSCTYTGQVTFWYNSSGTNATVNINGQSGTITTYYGTYNPTCGSSGCATSTLPTGTYAYTASSSFSNWSGNVTITKHGCALQLLQ
jgi:hypothetical protein